MIKDSKFWLVRDIAVAILLALFVRTFIMQAYKIPSGSMIPTLLPGDYIFVNRLAYGIRMPYKGYLVRWGKVKRGDIVVFVFPEDRKKDFVKRVIALPGEEVKIKNKKIYINNVEIEDKWGIFSDSNYIGYPRDDFGPVKVPPDSVFVLGDNRDESNDSRYWGFVPIENIKGKPLIIYFSIGSREGIRFKRLLSVPE